MNKSSPNLAFAYHKEYKNQVLVNYLYERINFPKMNIITIIGLVAAALTTISTLPQAIKSWKTKKTGDLSLLMYSFFSFGVLLWLIYGISIGDLPLILANTVTFILASFVLVLKIKYK